MLHNCYIFVKGKKAIKENVTSLGPKKKKELHLFVGLLMSLNTNHTLGQVSNMAKKPISFMMKKG